MFSTYMLTWCWSGGESELLHETTSFSSNFWIAVNIEIYERWEILSNIQSQPLNQSVIEVISTTIKQNMLKLHLHLSASVCPPVKCRLYLSLTAVVWDVFTGAAGKLEKQKSAFSETMEIVMIYTIDFELRQNKNDLAAYWSPSCLLHLSVVVLKRE